VSSRFAFYWEAQKQRCALMITEACRMHAGLMIKRDEPAPNGKIARWHPTWDHIYPKPRTRDQEPVQLLACRACNNERGNAPARPEYVARALMLLEDWVKTNPAGARGVPRAKVERRRIEAARQVVSQQKKARQHPKIPLGSPGAQMMATISRAERNAESRAAALKHIAEGLKKQGMHADADIVTAKAANILAAVRGKPPERK
jgi:hypothetical protein